MCLRDDLYHLSQVHVGSHFLEVGLHDILHVHQGQDRPVLVVGQQVTLLGKTHRIDAVRLEDDDGQVGTDGDNHQSEEQVIAPGQLGNEEDAGQGSMHHARHQSCHPQQGKVLLRNVGTQVELVAEAGKDEARDASQEQAGRKDTATTTASVGRTRSVHLEEDDEQQVDQQQVAVPVEERVVEHTVPVCQRGPVEQQVDGGVSFTVKRRKEEDEHTQHHTAYGKLDVRVGILAEDVLHRVHRTGEVERHQPAGNAQQDGVRDAFHHERIVEVETEHGFHARSNIGEGGCRHAGDEQREERCHRQVNHQHFEREDQSGNGCLEDACHGSGSTAADQQHECLVLHPEHASQVGAYRRTGQHNRRLGTH